MANAQSIADIHVALVNVVSAWSESDVQTQVAESVGVALDPTAIRAVYLLGLHGGAGVRCPRRARLDVAPDHVEARRPHGRAGRGRPDPHRPHGRVRLAPAGEQAYARLVDAGHRLVADALAGWDADEISAFRHQLTRFVFALAGTPSAPSIQEESS